MRSYFGWLAKVVTILVLVFIIVPVFVGALVASSTGLLKSEVKGTPTKRVMVIEMVGEIMGSKEILEDLYSAAHNNEIKGIILRVDSPGGAVAPSQDVYEAIKKLKERKPIVVSMGKVAASGGLYSALSASKILVQPGTLTGSIGVIMQVPNFTKVKDKIGVDMVTIKSGKLKDAGNMFRKMTDDEKNFLEGTVDEVQKAFVDAVIEGRGLSRKDVEKFADGRVILGSQAVELGLVDGFGDLYDAGRAVFELRNEPLGEDELPQLEYAEDEIDRFFELFETISKFPSILRGGMELRYSLQ